MYNDPKTKKWKQMEDIVQLKLDPIQHFPENSCSPGYQADIVFPYLGKIPKNKSSRFGEDKK